MAARMAVGHLVGVEDRRAFHMAGRPADGLDQRAFAAQEAFLVRIQDRHQRDFGQVQPSRSRLMPTTTS